MAKLPFSSDTPSIDEVVEYINKQIKEKGETEQSAYAIVSIVSLPNFDDLTENPHLERIFSLAGDLEIPGGTEEGRVRSWSELKSELKQLEASIKA